MMRRLLLLALAGAAVGCCSGIDRARADADAYVSQRQVIRVGVLVSSAVDMGGTYGNENPDPHVFYVLDARTDLKPSGVELTNPLAPSVITGNILARWKNRVKMTYNATRQQGDPAFQSGTAEYSLFQIGARVTKNMGCYWEVDLDNVTSEDLAQFDLLYIHTHKANVNFTTDQIVRLRRFVDGGGTLWLDNCGGFTLTAGNPFLIDVQFANGGGASSGAVIGAPNHPLLTYPYALTREEVQYMGDKFVGGYYLYNDRSNPADPTQVDAAPGRDAANPPGGSFMVPVVWNSRGLAASSEVLPNSGWRPYVLAGQLGAGRLVMSAMDSGCAVNDYVGGWNAGYGGNSAAISGESLQGAHPRDLKFLYNMVSWASAHTTPLTDVRRSGGTSERLASALEEKWSPTPPNGGLNVGGVALYKHCVYFVDTACVLHCFNASPGEDLDNDGNTDDGVQDYILGAPYDELWRLDLKGLGTNVRGASAPTIVQFYDPTFTGGGSPGAFANPLDRDLVVVVLSDGTVVAARALPRASTSGLPLAPATNVDWVVSANTSGAIPYALSSASNPGGQVPPVPAAAWAEGVVFVALNTSNGGRIAAIDPRSGTSAFHLGRSLSSSSGSAESMVPDTSVTLPEFWTTPTVGYIRDETTGAIDKVISCQMAGTGAAGGRPASLSTILFGAKGEPLAYTGTTRKYRCTRSTGWWWVYGQNGDDNANLRPRVYNRNGTTTVELKYTTASSPGANEYTILWENNEVRVVVGALDPALGQLYADYTLDWAPASSVTAAQKVNIRSALVVPERANAGNYAMGGPPALAPTDIEYYNALLTAGTSGAGPGTSTLTAAKEAGTQTAIKWSYPVHNGVDTQVAGTTISLTPRIKQTDQTIAGVGQYVCDVRFIGSPAVRNDVVYAVATANVRANPSGTGGTAVSLLCAFRANPIITIETGSPISSPNTAVRVRQPNVFAQPSASAPPMIDIPQAQLGIDTASGTIKINSFAKGQLPAECGGTSLPFIVQIGTEGEMLVTDNPDYQSFGVSTRIAPAGTLDNLLWYVVIPADLVLPSSVSFSITSPTIQSTSIGRATSGPSVQGTVIWVGWENGCVLSFDADPGANDPSVQGPGSQVPIYTGVFASGTEQTGHLRWISPTTAGPVMVPPAGSGNLLAVNSLGGMRSFEDTMTVVADARRLIEVNAAGEAVWVCEGSRSYSVAGGDLPVYLTDPNSGNVVPSNPGSRTGVQVVKTVPWARPSVVRHVSLNDLMVVDTGNNRVLQVDRGGNVAWEISEFYDSFKHVLRAGDPLSLNEPTDCAFWTEFFPNLTSWFQVMGMTYRYDQPGFVVHYLIADTGNYRVIEVVDVYDSAGRVVTPNDASGSPLSFTLRRQVNFVSSTYGSQNKRYRYRGTVRLTVADSILPTAWQTGAVVRYLTLAAIDNARLVDPATPARSAAAFGETTAGPGGSLVVLKEDGTALGVINRIRIPLVAAPDPGNDADYWSMPVVAPTYVSYFIEVTNGTPMLKVLCCDANGCYQARPQFVARADGFTETVLDVEWLLTAQDYYLMTGKRLQASSIRRLNAGAGNAVVAATPALHQFLIVNRYSGDDDPTVFGGNDAEKAALDVRTRTQGEVFVLNPALFSLGLRPAAAGILGFGYQPDYIFNAGAGTLVANPAASIVRRIPNEVPVNSGGFKGFSRLIGDPTRATSSSVLEQPASADRPQ